MKRVLVVVISIVAMMRFRIRNRLLPLISLSVFVWLSLLLAAKGDVNVAIVYHSVTNHTESLAKAIGSGCSSVGASVKILRVEDASYEKDVLEWADALIIGSPTHYGNPSAGLLAWVEDEWEEFWKDERSSSMVGGIFATGGGIAQGIEHVLASLTRLLWSFRFNVVSADPTRSGFTSYGAVGITGTPPFNATGSFLAPGFIDAAYAYGAKIVGAVSDKIKT